MKKRNFKESTKILFLKYTIIPILTVIVLFSIFIGIIYHFKMIYDTNQAAENIGQKYQHVYEIYKDEIQRISESRMTIYTLRTHSNINHIYESFYNFNLKQDVKSAFYLVDNYDILVASTNNLNDESRKSLLNKMIPRLDKTPNQMVVDVNMTKFMHGKMSSITLGKAVQANNEIVGYVVYKLYTDDLQRLVFGQKADIAVITDAYDHIIVASNDIVYGLMNKFLPEKVSGSDVSVNGDSYYMKQQTIEKNNFRVYALNRKETDYFTLFLYFIFVILICVLLFFLIKLLAEKMSEKNTESINKLLFAISHLKKGDLNAYVNINTGDEFEFLASQYNDMLDNLNNLLIKNKELSDIKNANEIKLLQSQFNPHFLFNVLEMLRFTMVTDIEKSQKIILSLSSLLRYSINDNIENVQFKVDLNYIMDYLKLHKLRFDNRLHYHLDIAENVKEVYVPKLLLQPIIENAIKYGYANQSVLNIYITAELADKYLLFTVTDDGKGIEEEKLFDIRENLNSKSNTKIGIGLYNTHRRLVLQYGEEYGLNINSIPNNGTKVEIKIPYDKGGVSDV